MAQPVGAIDWASLILIFGPVVVEWLKKLLERREQATVTAAAHDECCPEHVCAHLCSIEDAALQTLCDCLCLRECLGVPRPE